jgi:hypothetical protein
MSILHSSLSGGLSKYTFRFTASEGVISGIGGLSSNDIAFSGPLNQELVADLIPNPTQEYNAFVNAAIDTQFLVTTAQITWAVPPFETATTLGGEFVLHVPARAPVKDLVQIVAPTGARVAYNFEVIEEIPPPRGSQTNCFSGVVPEPGTSAMMAVGALIMTRWRRERRRCRSAPSLEIRDINKATACHMAQRVCHRILTGLFR